MKKFKVFAIGLILVFLMNIFTSCDAINIDAFADLFDNVWNEFTVAIAPDCSEFLDFVPINNEEEFSVVMKKVNIHKKIRNTELEIPILFYKVNIPSEYNGKPVTEIGDNAFLGCVGLKSITIPDSITSVGNSAFAYCTGLDSITIPDSITSFGNSAFAYCTGLDSITIPDNIDSIGASAFYRCTELENIELSNNIDSIGNKTFFDCTKLTNITIPNSVIAIGDLAFSGCVELKSITIGSGVVGIGDRVFSDCYELTTINYDGTKNQWYLIYKKINWNSFSGNYTIICTDGEIQK